MKDEWKETIEALSDISFHVTQQNGTERPFTGILNKEVRKGKYTCIVCKTLLFSDLMKFDSGCGWPAFHSEDSEACISRIVDVTHGMVRTEVRCGTCDAHLGHVFKDGPRKHGGERYCINSAAMEFEVNE